MPIKLTKDEVIKRFPNIARTGDRIIHIKGTKPSTLWAGLGNRSGLHDFAFTLIREKWEESGERFTKKLDKIVKPGEEFQIQQFSNINRDRGKWVTIQTIQVI